MWTRGASAIERHLSEVYPVIKTRERKELQMDCLMSVQ
jgi:hypothetical protein